MFIVQGCPRIFSDPPDKEGYMPFRTVSSNLLPGKTNFKIFFFFLETKTFQCGVVTLKKWLAHFYINNNEGNCQNLTLLQTGKRLYLLIR